MNFLDIMDIAIKCFNGKRAGIVITAMHNEGIKIDDIFITDDAYFPLKVIEISNVYDTLVPAGYFGDLKFDKNNSLEEINEIRKYSYRWATPEEKKNIDDDSCLL